MLKKPPSIFFHAGPSFARRAACRAMAIALSWLIGSAVSAPPAASPPPAGTQESDTPDLPPADETIREANALLDRWDADEGDDSVRATVDALNRLLIALQAVDPANPWLPYFYGRVHALNGRNGDAIEQLRRFVETRDGRNEWKAFRLLGDLFVGEFPRLAKVNYDRAAELNPIEPTVLMGLSVCAAKTGDRDEALRLARAAAAADGRKRVRFIQHLARTLSSMRQWDEAEREALAGLRLAEENARRRPGRRGPLQVVANQYDLLIEIIGAKLAESSNTSADDYVRLSDYVIRRAELAVRLAAHDRLALLQRGMESTENPTPRLLEHYATALAEVGQNDEAITQFQKLLAVEPDNPRAREYLARLRSPTLESNHPPPSSND